MITIFNNNLVNPLFLETNLLNNGVIIDNRYKVSINNNNYYFSCKNLDNTEKPFTLSHGRFFLYLLYKISVSKTNEIYITYEEYRQFRQINLLSNARKEFNKLFQLFRNLIFEGKYKSKNFVEFTKDGNNKTKGLISVTTRFLDSFEIDTKEIKTNLKQGEGEYNNILSTSKGITMVINSDFFKMIKDSFFLAISEDIFTYNLNYNKLRYLLMLNICHNYRLNNKKTISKKLLERLFDFDNISENRHFKRVKEQIKKDFDYFVKTGFLKNYTMNNFENVNSNFFINFVFSKEINAFFNKHKPKDKVIIVRTKQERK